MSDCPRLEAVMLLADRYADATSPDMRGLCRKELCAAVEQLEMELVETLDYVEELQLELNRA